MTAATAARPVAGSARLSRPVLALTIAAGIVAGAACVDAVAGLYHALDSWSAFHSWWHTTVPDKATRNDIRDVVEYLTGGYGAQLYTWNSAKWHLKGGGSWLDKLDERIPGLNAFRQWVRRFPVTEGGVSYILSLPAAAIGFTALYFITRAIPAWSWHVPIPHFRHALLLSSVIVNHKAMGLAASYFFGRHMMRLWYDDMQGSFAVEAARRQRNPLSFLWLPTYRRRVEAERLTVKAPRYGTQVRRAELRKRVRQGAARSLLVLGFAWFVFYGYLVLKYTAHLHPMPWGLR